MKKALAFLFALIFLFGLSIPGAAAAPKAAVIRIQLVEGTVNIKDASGVAIKFSPDMKLFSGYSVETGDNSCAYINLDDEKAIKLDMNTTVTIKKSGNKLKVDLKAGQLIFNVTAPLAGDESLEIRTSTMVTGIRGSSGGVNAETGEIFYGTGHGIVWFRETDQTSSLYGLPQCTELWGGRIVSVNWPVRDMELSDFSALFLGEVAENPDLQNSLKMEGRFDPQDMINLLPIILEAEIAAREEAKSSAVPLPETATDSPVNGDNINPAFNKNWDLPTIVTPHPIFDLDDFVIPDNPLAYTVTWKDEDGTILEKDENVPVGTVPEFNGSTPIKAADAQYTYTFAGWDSIPAAVTGNAVYTATYKGTPKTYTVTWKDENGTILETDENVAFGSTPSFDAETPAKAADAEYTYTFAGWSPEVSDVTGNETYTATYSTTTNTYTITWKDENGTVLETDENVAFGSTPSFDAEPPAKAADAEYTYTFAGWSPEVSKVTGDETYTATYSTTTNTYTITWKQDDGNLINTTIVAYGEVPAHDDPTKTADAQYSYTFAGWDPEPAAVTGDAAYTATYSSTVNKYTVSFIDDDGVTNLIEPALYEYGTPAADIIEPYMTTKDSGSEDYKFYFDAWDTEITEVKGDAIYYATYYKKYRISFEMNGHGSAMDDIMVKEGEYAAPPDIPTDAEYEFVGWYSDQELTVPFDFENTVITEAKTLYAKWRMILAGADPFVTVSVPAEMEPYVTITVYDESDNPYDNPSPIAEGTIVYVSLEVDPDYYFIGPKTSLVAEAGETAILATGLMEDDNYSLIAYTVTADDTTITVKNLYQVIDALDNTHPLTMDSAIRTAVTATDAEIDFDLYIDREGLLVVNSGVEVAESATVTIEGRLSAQADAVNNGTIINNHQFDIAEAGTYSNTGSITNNGIMEINGGVLNNSGDINNYGTLNNNGYLYSNENTINNNGTLLNTDMLFIGSDSGDSTLNNLAGARLISEGLITIRESSALENYGLFFAGGDGLDDLHGGYANHNAEGEATYGGYCSDDLGWLVFETEPDTYILYITGDGAMKDFDTTTKLPPWIEFLPGTTAVRFYAGITRLGNYAFYNEGTLISATFEGDPPQLPDTPSSVFDGSDGAFTVYYPSGNPQWAEEVSGGTWAGYPADAGS